MAGAVSSESTSVSISPPASRGSPSPGPPQAPGCAGTYAIMIGRLGWKAAQRQLGITINAGGPTRAEPVQAVSREHLS
jgi:hypothetical protein